MAFCRACGQELGGAVFCPKCGASQGAPAPAAAGGAAPPVAAAGSEGMAENVAGLLSYLVGWITGLIFLLIDKRPFVRFHAAQSIAFNISIIAVYIVFWIIEAMLTFITAMMHFPIGFLFIVFFPVLGLAIFIAWIFLMYKAYSGEKFKLPIIGNLVEGMVK
jgi:uncharacterized membrane protein